MQIIVHLIPSTSSKQSNHFILNEDIISNRTTFPTYSLLFYVSSLWKDYKDGDVIIPRYHEVELHRL
ncbi:hypothetical protein QR98_0030920 [Sarcoptes scabiei]|uniref:Uncharacterized protein n=1 Tax=Sarcoptes scabiei TaxID=52283 RepID=A0A132A141_SARSC|nr:hypothetical protein QR98_0030920 [Sarcoptes scabiei]